MATCLYSSGWRWCPPLSHEEKKEQDCQGKGTWWEEAYSPHQAAPVNYLCSILMDSNNRAPQLVAISLFLLPSVDLSGHLLKWHRHLESTKKRTSIIIHPSIPHICDIYVTQLSSFQYFNYICIKHVYVLQSSLFLQCWCSSVYPLFLLQHTPDAGLQAGAARLAE